ncbi:hypothetical protein GCM10007939_22250 [Amylibacter marinus]|uniref:Bacterial type II secretion system protein E domain-containing protein n=1 Tax=Amylibacter marinus TaxID=1475483 RepID=A0ABQ5VWX9_9RHOB|nr:ATPase, T2SS/T4P/T4SS family [Amylibacter marinus]GLQ35941.1 hypothetical protein GCM10007939_22250 [Amylibacter marinus]
MDLILEVKYPGESKSEKFELDNGVYVIGNQEKSDKGKPVQINSPFVTKDHALVESTKAGWVITALKPQIRMRSSQGNQLLDVRDPKKVGPNSAFVVGNIEFQFLAAEQSQRAAKDDGPRQGASLDALISDVHLRLTKETQLLTRIEKPDTEDPEYMAQVREILKKLTETTLGGLKGTDLHELAGDAARRDLIYRHLGGDGVLTRESDVADFTDADKLALDKIQNTILGKLDINDHGDSVEVLAKIKENYQVSFAKNSKSFSNSVLRKLLQQTLVSSVDAVVFGIGPLEYLRENDNISEIMVIASDKIFVELKGNLVETGLSFVDEKSSTTITSYIVGRVGKQINVQNPYEDARLLDGSRVNAVVSPVAIDGTALTIRKFSAENLGAEQFIEWGAMSAAMASFLRGCVVAKKNIVVSGGTGTGKTTMVNWLATLIPPDERIVTCEDVAELQLGLPHVVRLEARPASADGEGEVSIRDLVKNSLRMRPDRVVIGECRGGEAFDMLQAMNTGHEGSMTTLHANNGVEAMSRMENLVLMADQGLPIDAIRYQISGAVDFVVQLKRYPNGARKISEVCEIGGIDKTTNRIEVSPIFETRYDYRDSKAKANFAFAGTTPEGIEEIIKAGFDASELSF